MSNRTDQYAAALIQAVQSGNVDTLIAEVKRLEEISEWEWLDDATRPRAASEDKMCRRRNYIDSQFGPLGLTALHVAVKGYATHTRELGRTFDQMTRILLDAGANHAIPFGVRRAKKQVAGVEVLVIVEPGKTIAQECFGNLPPSLLAALASMPPDTLRWGTNGEQSVEMDEEQPAMACI